MNMNATLFPEHSIVRVWPTSRVNECFQILADKQPAAPAIISDNGIVSYAELDQKANALANALLARGVEAEEAVGVLADRSGSLPQAFLGILKAGGAYVPMGAALPPDRLANMAFQSGMRCLIVLDGLEPPATLLATLATNDQQKKPAIFRPEELHTDLLVRNGHRRSSPGTPMDIAAILFTSGSTGQPKGVLLQHDACINMGYGHINAQKINPTDRVLLAAAPGFIMGFRELCLPLLAGAAFVPASRALLDDPVELLRTMSRHRVTVAMFTPSYLRLFQGEVPDGLRCLLTAGERPNDADARTYAQKVDYWNIQGATEVCGTICMLRVDPLSNGPLSSGHPFANTAVYLLDSDGKQVPHGEVGEIHVVGVGVARGYLNQPQPTAERFVETKYGRAFRSNDLGRWNADGQLESLGRANDVVKISGQSVALGEIEQTLLRHDAVRNAAVVQHQGKLIAFVESDQQNRTSLEDWHCFLGRTLPTYMLPADVMTLLHMPLNAHGKVDRQALLALGVQEPTSEYRSERGAPPIGEVEQNIARVWEEVLNVRPVMREDNFFSLGGTSLLAIVISQRLQALGYAVSAQSILASMTVAGQARTLTLDPQSRTRLVAAPAAQQGIATSGQEDFWIAWKLGLAAALSHITRVLVVQGTVPEPTRWQTAWIQLLARHAAMRTAFFAEDDEKVSWRTVEAERVTRTDPICVESCASLSEAGAMIAARLSAPFDLTMPPLARAGLVRVTDGPGKTLFWFALHHSVSDGLSAQVVQQEMHSLLLERALPSCPSGVAQASWAERDYLVSHLAERDRAYWQEVLHTADGEAFQEFTTDIHRPASASEHTVAPLIERLDARTVQTLTRLAQSQQVGLHALLLTLLEVEARRRDGRSSLIIGTSISIRPPGADSAVGYFVNVLPLVLTRSQATTFAEHVRATQRALTAATVHGGYPASLLYREFRKSHPHARAHSRTSLFDISLTSNQSGKCGDATTDFSLTPTRLPGEKVCPVAGVDLAFSHEQFDDDSGGGLEFLLLRNPDAYSAGTAQAWLNSIANWARWLAEDVRRADAPLPALLPEEALCLAQWEWGPERTRPAKRVHELFESIVDSYPERAAVITEADIQSYAELDQRANSIARALLNQGVVREEAVAVLTECSADLPATVLGIWKAGAAYLPLTHDQPSERLAHIARDSGARTLIVLDGHAVAPSLAIVFQTIIRPEACYRSASHRQNERLTSVGSPQDLAYIIYTSGTTGTPKGVLIQHDGLVDAVYSSWEVYGLTAEDRVALVASPGFDASLWELGLGLVLGVAMVPVSRALRDDPWALKQWYKEQGVTVAFHVPSYLRISQEEPFEGLRILVTGGEAPNHDDARAHASHLAFWNGYGPTEASVLVTTERLSPLPDAPRPISAGKPLPNTRISIRRDNGAPVPPGAVGEAWLSGIGLARGYLNNPDLTALRFVETPDGRFYRSGDWGRWTDDGRLVLLGRIDDQIKLHGQRLELGEIEQALRLHPVVADAVILVDSSANETKSLRAFVRMRPATVMPTHDEWRDYLISRVPRFMVPDSVTVVAEFPLNPSGKINRDALLHAPRERCGGNAKSPPSGDIEMRIAAIWNAVLGERVAREDDFFALGGNSLLAVTMAHRLSLEFARPVLARDLYAAPTLGRFSKKIAALLGTALPGHNARVPVRSDLATEAQREFRVAEAAGLDTRTFTIPVLRVVDGAMPSSSEWNVAWATLVARHDALRTYFHEDSEGHLHLATVRIVAQALDAAKLPDMSSAQAFVRQRQREPFVMGVPPLWRAGLVYVVDSRQHLFWLALHHSVGDGRSIAILVEELSALLRGEGVADLACDFAESATKEQVYLADPACVDDAKYWRDLLALQPDSAFDELALDVPRSAQAIAESHRFETRLDRATSEGLKALARRHDASLHAVMLTLLAVETRRLIGRERIVIGTAASNRETAAEMQVVGDYVNMLAVPCRVPHEAAFGTALREIQQSLVTDLQHARYPFSRVYHDFWSARPLLRHPTRYPIFDLAVIENPDAPEAQVDFHLSRLSAPSAESVAYEHTETSPGQDMVLSHEVLPDGSLLLQWHVNAAIYSRQTASCWFEALRGWAAWLAEDPLRAKLPLPRLLPREAALLEIWEPGATVDRPCLRFHEHFERLLDDSCDYQVERPCIVAQSEVFTYGQLESEANAIAHRLLLRGVTPGAIVGVLTNRSAALPSAVLGIWKAGATYLPLAADLPAERLSFMARDAGVSRLIALDGLTVPPALALDLPPALRPEEMDETYRHAHSHRPRVVGSADDIAYVIYTSGSTGRPKGISISHSAYVNTVLGVGESIGLTGSDRCLMFASPSFDVSLSDIGMPLAFGAALCPISLEVLSSPNIFRAFLTELGVTVADVTPTYLRLFDGAPLPSLRILITGGEPPFAADVQTYAGRHRYFDAYGPSENAITSTLRRLRPDTSGFNCGARPLPNTSIHVCDPEGNPLAPGVMGEIWLGGTGLAQGYVGRADLTASAFVETAHGRRYRSGDLGRWRACGELEVLGRVDDQVKLNGVRIELGEIEHTLDDHPDITQAVALLDGDADRRQSIFAFVRPLPGKPVPPEAALRAFLAARLPTTMIPSAVLAIAEVPLTISGKVDKAALRALLDSSSLGEDSSPQAGLEADIASLWCEILGRSSIGRNDNFFALGGHSLLAIAMVHRLEEMLGHPVPARELFAEPTLSSFTRRVDQLRGLDHSLANISNRATEGQLEFWVAEQAGLDTRGFNIPLTMMACGKIPPAEQWRSAWALLLARHDALRTAFHQDREGVLRREVTQGVGDDWETCSKQDLDAALVHIRERQAVPFVMHCPPLVRAGLVQVLGTDQHVFWLALHHSVGDGVSIGVLVEDLTSILRGDILPPIVGHFDDVAGREEAYLAELACQQDAVYWQKVLSCLGDHSPDTPQPFDEWPLDFPRPLGRTLQNAKGAHSFRVDLGGAVAAGLRDLARKFGASMHALMLTIMAKEVWRRTERPEFLIGTAASTRDSASEDRIVGYCVNTLPVPCRVHGRETFEQAVRVMQRSLADGLQHARYPFARTYRDFRSDHGFVPHPARHPLFDLVVTDNPGSPESKREDNDHGGGEFHFASIAAVEGDALRYEFRAQSPAQDMVLVHEGQQDGSLILHWYVNAALYEKETAEAWIESLAGWARYLVQSEQIPRSSLPALLPQEEVLLATWERGATLPPAAPSLPARFEHWARNEPERPAIVTEQVVQSYATLNARANALAHALRERGVVSQEVVGVLTDRSIVLPEIVLSIWKAGGCYLPLLKDLPADRLAFIARDAGIRLLVVLDGHEPPTALTEIGCNVLRPESVSESFISNHCHLPPISGRGVRGSDLAYIIYTSGSTGVPKGVMLHHQGLNNLGVGTVAALGVRSDDRALMMASPAFDASIAELALAFTAGAALVPVLTDEMNDIACMQAKVAQLRVTVAMMTPSYLRLFEQADLPSVRILMTVGEAPYRADARHYATRLRYMNGYGPTENTAAASYGEVTAQAQRTTAGRPMANTAVHIRNSRGETVPPGAVGQIWLSGMGLALGYLNRPDLTAANFVEMPSGRFYRTGDLGRWTRCGELQILGRSDGQVKLGGQRVELGEIEQCLATHSLVSQAVAAVDTQVDGTPTLWAFVCLHDQAIEPTQAEWHDHLSRTLPSYMLPSAVLRLAAIPVSTAGKVDRAELVRAARERKYDATEAECGGLRRTQPRDDKEQRIAQVWAECLECKVVAREDDFFDLGGNSLRVIAVVNQLRRTFRCAINDLYEHPRLGDFATRCSRQPEHLRTLVQSAALHWQGYRRTLDAYDAERNAALNVALRDYKLRNVGYQQPGNGQRRDYSRVLLTGATGYLGNYLLRELLADAGRSVTVLVRGSDDRSARARLGRAVCHYFGPEKGAALLDDPCLTVLAGDLRRDDLGLSCRAYDTMASGVQAIFHCAANVKHFGHYWEFHEDNVSATQRLLKLAAQRTAQPADFHFVSTLSTCGNAPAAGFRLFTEYDAAAEVLDDNYYIRSKQEAERLVVAARQDLANACIHRVGNVVFAAEGGPLQINIKDNAFFRQLAAFLRLGVVPDDSHIWLCHVDIVARAMVRLATAADLTNETHHLESDRRDLLATFVSPVAGVHACGFDGLLQRLEAAVDEPHMQVALSETLENLRLFSGLSPQSRARRLEIVSDRTQILLARLGVVWPLVPLAGQRELLRQAGRLYSQTSSSNTTEETRC